MPSKRLICLIALAAAWFLAASTGCAEPAMPVSDASSHTPTRSSGSSTPTDAPATMTHAPSATSTRDHTPTPLSRATATRARAYTPTATRTVTPSPTARATVTPTETESPTPTATPAPVLRQLTVGGCCTGHFWSPDSRQVLFIDQPAADAPLGIWGVDIEMPDPEPTLYTERIASYTSDLAFVIEPDPTDRSVTIIERVADGERWSAPAGGRSVSLSPARTRLAWQVTDDDLPSERRVAEVWIANLDGSDARLVASLPRGGVSGWIDEDTLLISSRESLEAREQVISSLRLTDGARTELARGERLRGGALSPDGGWYLYMVTFDADAAANGLWIMRTDGSDRRQLDPTLFGSYRWRDERQLLIIPLNADAEFHELWELDVETDIARRLIDPADLPFKVGNGDWSVSPDGRHVAFMESRDRNIWMLTLPQ
jgi:hypothetical protein